MLTIEVTDHGVHSALTALRERVGNLGPCLKEIGEDVAGRTTLRFNTQTGPDGKRWPANARSTIAAFIAKRRGFGKKGINKKGQGLAMSKKPLFATGVLAASIRYQLTDGGNAVEIGTNRFSDKIATGAAIHQFGGQAGKGHKVKIPARPFLPIQQNGELYPQDKALILEDINRYLAGK